MPKLTPEQLRAIDGAEPPGPPTSHSKTQRKARENPAFEQAIARGFHVARLDDPKAPECLGAHPKGYDRTLCDLNPKSGKQERGKHPLGRWTAEAKLPPDRQGKLFDSDHQYNTAIDCGLSGIFVLDEDANGVLERFCQQYGITLPPTYRVQTGNGWHYYFKQPDGEPIRNNNLRGYGFDLDVKGNGGYVVGAGSRHYSGTEYRAEDADAEIAEAPDELLRVLRELSGAHPAREAQTGTTAPGSNQTRLTLPELLDNPPTRGDGTTNNWLTQTCGHLAREHRADYSAYMVAARSAVELVDPGYEDFDKTAASVWRKEQAKPSPEDQRAAAVKEAVERLLVGYLAKQEFKQELALLDPAKSFDAGLLTDYLGREEVARYRVQGLMLRSGATIVSAKRKTGKTTFNVNLAYSLITGEPFLDTFEVEPLAGRVAVLNFEVTGAQFAHWASRVGVPDDRMVLVNLRGRRNPLTHPADRLALAEYLREQQVELLIVDPFSRAFTGANQNDVSEVGTFLTDLDLFTSSEVGAADLVLSVHTGWNGERSRGSSGLEDWPDSIIRLTTREDSETGPRFMSAIGRDVEMAEDELELDPATSRLRLTGSGSRKAATRNNRVGALSQPILEAIRRHPGMKSTELYQLLREAGATFRKGEETQALQDLVDAAQVSRVTRQNARMHYLPKDVPQTLGTPAGEEAF